MKYLIIILTLLLTGCRQDADHMSNRIAQNPMTEGKLEYIGITGDTHLYRYENDTERCYVVHNDISCVTR